MSKQLIVEDSFWNIFPDVEIGVVCVDGILPTDKISDENQQKAIKLLDEANAAADKWLPSDTISRNPVVAVWRQAYQRFKTKKGARCSVENLLKRVLNGKPVGHIVPSVDVSNAISLKYALPIGAENIDAIKGDLRLKLTDGGDEFLPVGETINNPTLLGEIAYVDDAGAVCRCWNWRDGQRTEVTDETPHCMFIMENVDPSRSDGLHKAIEEMGRLAEEILGGTVTSLGYATKENPSIQLK